MLLALVVGCLLCLGTYALSGLWPRSRDAWLLGFGIAAAMVMLGVGSYGIRRRLPGAPLGRAATWLKVHLFGGVLFGVLVLMHSQFRFPAGGMNRVLWVLSLWVTATGLIGLWIQRWIPRAIASGLSDEVLYDRIPELVRSLGQRAETFVASCSDPIQAFYQTNLAAMFAAPQASFVYYADVTGGRHARKKQFEYLSHALGGEERGKLDRLERMYKAKLELDAHLSLQRALRWWLVAHVPFSIVLVVLVVLHVIFVLSY